jgi:hypothetical protein
MQTCLRPQLRFLNCGEVVLYECEVIVGQCSITGKPWGTTALWLVGKVKSIAPRKEVGRPAFAAIRRVEPVLYA